MINQEREMRRENKMSERKENHRRSDSIRCRHRGVEVAPTIFQNQIQFCLIFEK